jgi:serine/threonine protein kinase
LLSSPSIGGDAFQECPLRHIRVSRGALLEYKFPDDCVIEEIRIGQSVEEEKVNIGSTTVSSDELKDGLDRKHKKLNMSDYVIDLEEEYEIVGVIGENSQVELWKHRKCGEKVAVKSYPRTRNSQSAIQNQFLREVESLIKLDHPCIVKIKGYCLPTLGDGPKLINEYLEIGSLGPILGSGLKHEPWWTIHRRTNSVVGIVLGMNYIHHQGVIHRDLKPDNILLDGELRVRICDFGSSRPYEADVTMTCVGTPLYMAPEVADGHYDEKCDVYSFGLVLYEIITCDERFSGRGVKRRLYLDLQNGWRPDIPAGVTPLSKNLIERCWDVNPKNRPSFEEIWNELYKNHFELIPGLDRFEVDLYLLYLEKHGAKLEKG